MFWLVPLILFGCSIIQGAAGFAFGVLAVPLLVWADVALSQAVILVSVTGLVQTLWGSFQLRASITWRRLAVAWLLRVLSLPLGVYLLTLLDGVNPLTVKQVLGGLLLLIVAAQLLFKVQPRGGLHPFWGWLSFSISGLMMGLVSMGGPPVVLWVMAQNWQPKESRAFLMSLFLLTLPVQLLLLALAYQSAVIAPLVAGLLLSPVVLLGVTVGISVGNLLSRASLRKLTYLLLTVTGLASLFAAWLR